MPDRDAAPAAAEVAIDWDWQDALDRTFDQLTDLTFAGVEQFDLDHIREAVKVAFTAGAEYEIEHAARPAPAAAEGASWFPAWAAGHALLHCGSCITWGGLALCAAREGERRGLAARPAPAAAPREGGEVSEDTGDHSAESAAYALGYGRGLASRGLAPLLAALEADADAFIVLAGFPMAREIATERVRALDVLLEGGIAAREAARGEG